MITSACRVAAAVALIVVFAATDSNGTVHASDATSRGAAPAPPTLAPAPHDILKNRYISIVPGNELLSGFDIKVTLTETLVNGVTAVGDSWWAQAPDERCLSICERDRPAVPIEWDACPVVHLTGCPIIPTSTYEIRIVDGAVESDPPLIGQTQAKPAEKWYGDAVGFFDGTGWTGPQGITDFDDVLASIKTWQFHGTPIATHVSVTDIGDNFPGVHNNRVTNKDDVFQFIQAYKATPSKVWFALENTVFPDSRHRGSFDARASGASETAILVAKPWLSTLEGLAYKANEYPNHQLELCPPDPGEG